MLISGLKEGSTSLHSKNTNNGEASETTVFSNYTSYGNYGVPNKPSSVTVTKTYQAKTPAVSTNDFTYYSNGLLHEEKRWPGTSKESKITFSYNTVGNLSSSILSATGLTSRSRSFFYDSKNRFITSIIEPDGKTHSAMYNPIYGLPISKTEVNGLITTFVYDGFGRLALTNTPEGHDINSYILWNTQPQTNPGIYFTFELIPGRPDRRVYFDRLGRVLRKATDGFQYLIQQDNEYNSDGSLFRTSMPYYPIETPRWTTYEYDDFGRETEVNSNGLISTISYQGHSIETVDPSGRHKVTTLNGLGKPNQITEDNSPTITYDYNSFWGISSISTTGNTISYFYDQFGFQDSIYNAYAGGVKYIYNAFGELVYQKDAKNQCVQFTYDVLGRVETSLSPEGTTTYNYYTDGNGIRQLSGVSSPGNVSESYSYDTYGRLATYSKSIQNQIQMNYSFGYDTYGNNISMTYPTGLELVNVYDNNGYLIEIKKPDGYSIWKLNNLRATGMPSLYTLGYNTLNLDKQFNYNSFENLTQIKTGNWQQIYNFDDTTGNLMSRSYKDLTNPSTLKTETFQYDGLDRLRYAQVTGQQLQEINYNPSGNIISKSGLGNYTYDQSKTNSLLNVGNTEQLISSTAQNIQYNYHNKPDLITEGVLEYSLLYGADNQRIKSTLKNNSTEIRTMFYGPGYEKVVTPDSTWESCYISSPYGAEAMVVKKGSLERLYYIEKDHLGSIIGLISSTGSYVERHSYDSWGRRRNPTNWSFDNVPESKLTSWGYTGQEHLDMFGLINMNGRVYDPVLGRFLNVDPIIQNPYSSQGLNNYSYCINNPLRYIDPSGYTRSAVNASTITQPEDIIAFLNAYFSQGGNLPYAESQVSGWLPNTIWYDDQTRMVDFWVTVPGSYINVDDSEHESGFIPIKSITVSAIKVSVYLSILRNFSEIAFYRPNVAAAGQGGGKVKPGFDIDKAVDYINANAHSKSQGACSRYVQNALVAGGITDAKTQPVKAGGAYGPLLTKWGFTMITTTLDNYTPVKGDIGVIQGYPGGTPCDAGPCGHIQMYNGTQWVSDYLQSTNRPFYPGPTYQQNAPAFEIYRW